MSSAGFEYLYRRFFCTFGWGIRVEIEKGDNQVGVVWVDLVL